MSKKTINRLTLQLVKELKEHPHKDEIVALATAQLYDENDYQTQYSDRS